MKSLFGIGKETEVPYFTGKAYINPLAEEIANVTFAAGCINFWHAHEVSQTILVTDGYGWYQEKGKEARFLRPGDVVEIEKDIIHWHGAVHDHSFTHVVVTKGKATWYEAVAEEEYTKLIAREKELIG